MSETLIRPSLPTDMAAITEMYAWNVLHGTGTFETEPPDATEMARRRDEVLGRGLPWLVAELIARCTALGARRMFAVIGDSANAGSIGVHRACGFEQTGVMRDSGWKFDRWLDVVIMQRALGDGSSSAPAGG